MKLVDAPLNTTATVVDIDDKLLNELTKLTAMGILPGVRLRLVQLRPLPVFEIGYSRFAIDKELAELIYVECES